MKCLRRKRSEIEDTKFTRSVQPKLSQRSRIFTFDALANDDDQAFKTRKKSQLNRTTTMIETTCKHPVEKKSILANLLNKEKMENNGNNSCN